MEKPSPFLSDIEYSKLVQFNKDPILKEAVRKVLLVEIYERGVLRNDINSMPTKNFLLALAFDPQYNNEQLGADVRAAAQGISLLEQGFNRINNYKDDAPPQSGSDINRAL